MEQAKVEVITDPQDETALLAQINPMVAQANALVVTDDNAPGLGSMLKKYRDAKGVVDKFFDPPILKIKEALTMMTDRKKAVLKPINEAEQIFKDKGLEYQQEKRRLADMAAQKQREAQAKADEEAKLAQAALAEQAGQDDIAEQILEQPTPVREAIAPTVTKIKGFAVKEKWTHEITNNIALVEAVLAKIKAGVLPPDAIVVSKTMLNSQCTALKGAFAKAYPGTRCWPETKAAGARM